MHCQRPRDLHLDDWSLVQGPDKSIAIVADIYTRNIRGCNKNGILHVATGNANNIYVVVEIEGNLYLTRGATFSYYEFVQPLGTRLTDEEWQKMLEGFYSVFKAADKDLQFVLLTGVTKFSQVSVFSGFNQPEDISLSAHFDTLLGITEDELRSTFSQQIAEMAEEYDG